MTISIKTLGMLGILALCACDGASQAPTEAAAPDTVVNVPPPANVLEINARGMRFQGPESIPSGWTTIRMNNMDGMLHFAMLVRLPDGVTATAYSDDLGSRFQEGYELMLEGKDEEVAAVFGSMPGWVSGLGYYGGPGFASGGLTSEATTYLEPGQYLLECYIKSNDVFHSYSPVPGQLTMLLPLTVTETPGGMAEPQANATLTINDAGFSLTQGALTAGENVIRVRFETQTRYPSFVGQDVHVARIEDEGDIDAALAWMDWRTPGGLEVPAPVTFVGGINDVMPEGAVGYFSVDLSPGTYVFIGEAPEADRKGLLLEFDIE